jgi:hypothetical protein
MRDRRLMLSHAFDMGGCAARWEGGRPLDFGKLSAHTLAGAVIPAWELCTRPSGQAQQPRSRGTPLRKRVRLETI